MMHILITGGAGFIGSHLVELHLAKGDKVHVVDDLSTGHKDNLAPWLGHHNLHFDCADMVSWPALNDVVNWADRVYHLAAVVGVFRVMQDPTSVLNTNIIGCDHLLQAIAKTGWKPHTLIASSSEAYGHAEDVVLHEKMPLRIDTSASERWSYAISKITDEAMAFAYARKYKIPITTVRLFNTIGSRQATKYGMVVPRFVEQAVTGNPITVFGDGHQKRSFCDVRDTVNALELLVSNDKSEGEIVNVGQDQEVSINELAELVKKISDSNSEITHLSYDEAYGETFDEIRFRRPCLKKLYSLTQYQHHFRLEQTIKELVQLKREELG